MDRWINKVAIVTGASSGIGKAVTTKLVQHGMKVIGCARNEEKLKEIAATLNKDGPGEMFPFQCDVSDETNILSMFKFVKEKFGKLHICVNSAGLAKLDSLLTGTTEGWKRMFDVNVIALCICTREAVKLMNEGGVDDGHIINMNSLAGHIVAENASAYTATKFAVTALTEGLRQELRQAKSHIRSTSISPGYVETEFVARYLNNEAQAKAIYASFQCLQAEDVANAIVYAISSPAHVEINEMIIRSVEQTT